MQSRLAHDVNFTHNNLEAFDGISRKLVWTLCYLRSPLLFAFNLPLQKIQTWGPREFLKWEWQYCHKFWGSWNMCFNRSSNITQI